MREQAIALCSRADAVRLLYRFFMLLCQIEPIAQNAGGGIPVLPLAAGGASLLAAAGVAVAVIRNRKKNA